MTLPARQLLVVVQEEELVREGPVRGKERGAAPEEVHDAAEDDHGRPGARLGVAEGQLHPRAGLEVEEEHVAEVEDERGKKRQ